MTTIQIGRDTMSYSTACQSDFDAAAAGRWCQQVIEGLGSARPVSAQAQALFDALHSR